MSLAAPSARREKIGTGRARVDPHMAGVPFDLSSGWSAAAHVLLVIAIAGLCIALVVQVVSLGRWSSGRAPHGSRMRTGH